MRTLLAGVNPGGIVGTAPFYLKAYHQARARRPEAAEILIRGYDVDEAVEPMVEDLCCQSPDLLAFSCYIWNIEKVLEVACRVRSRLPAVKLLLGGPEVAPRAVDLLRRNPALDLIVVGEGEVTFTEVLDHFVGAGPPLDGIAGLTLRRGDEVFATAPRPLIEDLAEIPSPILTGVMDFDQLKGYLYGYETFRGCPFTCSYCYWGRMLRVRYFPMERVKAELAVLLRSSLRRIWLGDAVANLHKKRFKELLRTIIALDSETVIDFEMVAELLDEETIDLLGKLRDGYIAFGLQSINPRALASIHRRWNRAKFESNVRRLRQRTDKVKIYIDLIYGLPGDDLASYEAGIRFAMSLLPQKIQPHPLLLLPGSPLFDAPEAHGLVYEERAPHYVRCSNTFGEADMATAAAWTGPLFFYFNPAVNTAVILGSQLLEEEPLDFFQRLYRYVTASLDPTRVCSDLGIAPRDGFQLEGLLGGFLRQTLAAPRFGAYLPPLLDAVAFFGCRAMFHLSCRPAGAGVPVWSVGSPADSASLRRRFPLLGPHAVLRRFGHDLSALYRGNLLRSPQGLLALTPRVYDVVFNLASHGIFHVSEPVAALLAGCRGERSLEEIIECLAAERGLGGGETVCAGMESAFRELVDKGIVDVLPSAAGSAPRPYPAAASMRAAVNA